MPGVAILPVQSNVDAAYARYVELEKLSDADPALRLSLDHNIARARAWREWRDLFLAWDRRC